MRATIGKKIGVSIAVMLTVSIGVMLLVLDGLYRVKDALRQVSEIHEPLSAAAYEMEINVLGTGLGVMKYLETGHPQYRARVGKDKDDFAAFYAEFDRLVEESAGKVLAQTLKQSFEEFLAIGETLMVQRDHLSALQTRSAGGSLKERQRLEGSIHESLERFLKLRESMDDLLDEEIQAFAMRELQGAKQEAEQAAARVTRMLVVLIPLVLLLGSGMGVYLFQSIVEPMRRLTKGIDAVRQGDMNYRVVPKDPHAQDEWTALTDYFNRMVEQLETTTVSKTSLEASDVALRATVSTLHSEIAERTVAEEKAQAAESKYRSIFENAVEGIYQSTPQGRYISANPAMARLYGYDSPEALMAGITDIKDTYVEPAQRDDFRYILESKGQVMGFETKFYRKDGAIIWVTITARAVRDPQGAVQYYEGTIEDITERKKLETQLLHSQKMEAVGRLAGGIAHDFNNVLTAIMGYSTLLMSDLSSAEARNKNAAQIQKCAERAAVLTRQLLAFSRKQVLVMKVLNMNHIVRAVAPMLQRLIGEDIMLTITLSQTDLYCKSDAGQMEQVIMNLAVNARDAMPQGGTFTIQTQSITLDAAAITQTTRGWHGPALPGSYVMLQVSDTGCGMDLETQAHIFEPFFTTKEVGRGTGLGLSTVYGIVKQSGGHIWAYSEIGLGATFKIYLPLAGAVEQAPTEAVPAPPVGGTETLLLVEDDDEIRDLAGAALEQQGYFLLQAGSGEAAIRLSQKHTGLIHLLVTDVVMPGMSGRELAHRMKALWPDMKVLYMSGYTDDAIVRHGVLTEALTFLPKPFTLSDLTTKVRTLLDT